MKYENFIFLKVFSIILNIISYFLITIKAIVSSSFVFNYISHWRRLRAFSDLFLYMSDQNLALEDFLFE